MINDRGNPDAVVGFVNFPVGEYPVGGKGCFVRLVVLDKFPVSYMPCSGGLNEFFIDESFIGDDLRKHFASTGATQEQMNIEMVSAEIKYFPNSHDNIDSNSFRYVSQSFLSVITIGATGWSSYEWVCKPSDLTGDGLRLYKLMCKLYPTFEVRLLTFVDADH